MIGNIILVLRSVSFLCRHQCRYNFLDARPLLEVFTPAFADEGLQGRVYFLGHFGADVFFAELYRYLLRRELSVLAIAGEHFIENNSKRVYV